MCVCVRERERERERESERSVCVCVVWFVNLQVYSQKLCQVAWARLCMFVTDYNSEQPTSVLPVPSQGISVPGVFCRFK